jgi:spermidine/putrescine transport system permease protein
MKKRFSLSRTAFWITIIFLFLPLVVLVAYSFNEGKTAVWTGLSLKWYEQLFTSSEDLWDALGNSLSIALFAGFASTVIGTLGAIGVNWYKFKLRGYVRALTFLPLILPEIVLGISLLVYFSGLGLRGSWWTVLAAHVTFCLPFVYLMVMARLEEFDNSIIEAAKDLGATERQTLFKVILPMSMPGIVSGFLTAVTLSLEDFITTFLVAGPDAATLPSKVYGMLPRGGVSPVINALSTILIAGTVLLAIMARNSLKHIAAK